jgi:hypothetical protein
MIVDDRRIRDIKAKETGHVRAREQLADGARGQVMRRNVMTESKEHFVISCATYWMSSAMAGERSRKCIRKEVQRSNTERSWLLRRSRLQCLPPSIRFPAPRSGRWASLAFFGVLIGALNSALATLSSCSVPCSVPMPGAQNPCRCSRRQHRSPMLMPWTHRAVSPLRRHF